MFSTHVGGSGRVRVSRFSFSDYYPTTLALKKKSFDSYENDKKKLSWRMKPEKLIK